jgi:putative hydrolase of the HAD superfamily
MKKYKAVFFDLDHTLWDFDKNSEEALLELFDIHQLDKKGITSPEGFITRYRQINSAMWASYHQNGISKEELRVGRFRLSLEHFGYHDRALALTLADQYVKISPLKKNLLPGTLEILEYLESKYPLHIITNGFKEVQYLKLSHSDIRRFFKYIHISEEIGFSKPAPEIFHHAVRCAGTASDLCLMIGDNVETDILGARNSGVDDLLFNPNGLEYENHFGREIKHLSELKEML